MNVRFYKSTFYTITTMSAIPRRFFDEEDYLTREEMSPFKNEYYRGEIFAMAGTPLTDKRQYHGNSQTREAA
jgi:hypothetical protein